MPKQVKPARLDYSRASAHVLLHAYVHVYIVSVQCANMSNKVIRKATQPNGVENDVSAMPTNLILASCDLDL